MREKTRRTQQAHWEETYDKRPDFFGAEASAFGVRAASVFAQYGLRTILELGCGQGRDTLMLLQRGFAVAALDYAEPGLRQLEERARALRLEKHLVLRMHDARQRLPFPAESFDGCFSHMFFTMELMEEEIERIFGEVLRVLKPNGLNIYSVRSDCDPHFGTGRHVAEDMWQNPMGFVLHFFSAEKVTRFAKDYELLWLREAEESSPRFTKKQLFEVALKKAAKAAATAGTRPRPDVEGNTRS
jgi:SAM-dependent methyltransferase